MQDVYNKTMEMLFRGTKNLANNNAVMEVERSGDGVAVRSKDTQSYRQLALSSDCSLVAGERRASARLECVSCVRPHCDLTRVVVCRVCRGRVGSLCALQCGQCGGPTCGLCTQISPGGPGVCRSCPL